MGLSRILSYLPLVAAVFSASIAALSFPVHDVLERAATCSNSASIQCPGVPNGFCCGSSATCIVLASNTTLLCCPSGADCSLIQPITCDITQQDQTLHPDAGIVTTNLSASLPTCGSGKCCPFGYSCIGGTTCRINASQGSAPAHTSSLVGTSTPTVVPVIPSTSATPSAPVTTSNTSMVQMGCTAFPATAIVAGFFPGVFAGALLAFACFCLLGAHRRKQARLSGSFGKVSASISDPIYQEGPAIRTDFIRKQTSAPSTPTSQPTIQRVRSLFRKSAAVNDTEMPMTPSPRAPPGPQQPVTPRLQREPSGESINIFADPSTAREGRPRDSHQTTFTDMMERADLGGMRRGEPFVPRISPKSYNSLPRRGPR